MRFTIEDLLRATLAVAFLMACIGSQWRGDMAAILMLAILTGTVGIVAALIRYVQEKSPRYLMALGVLAFLLLASVLLLISDWPFRGRATATGKTPDGQPQHVAGS